MKTNEIVEAARTWIGTPYHNQASLKGVGCDCVGLARGIYREVYGHEPKVNLSYSPDWGDHNGNEEIIAAADRFLEPLELDRLHPGCVILIRLRKHLTAKHCLIYTGDNRVIHAFNNNRVLEEVMSDRWWKLVVRAYSYPDEV